MAVIIKLYLVFLCLNNLDAGGGHDDEDEEEKEGYKISNAEYNNSYVVVNEKIINIFGQSIAMAPSSNEYPMLVVSNFNYNQNKSAGSIFVFNSTHLLSLDNTTVEETGSKWVNESKMWKLKGPKEEKKDEKDFGKSVSFNKDFVVVGSPGRDDEKGNAYVYKLENRKSEGIIGAYKLNGKYGFLKNTTADESKGFGSSVGINNDNDIIIGSSNKTYIFRYSNKWKQEQLEEIADLDEEESGISVSITSKYLAVGAYRHDSSGSVYIYRKNGNEWELDEKLKSPTPNVTKFGCFGYSLSIADEGRIVIGAYNESNARGFGNAYLFVRDGQKWIPKLTLPPKEDKDARNNFGVSVSMDKDIIAIAKSRCENGKEWSGCVCKYIYNNTTNRVIRDSCKSVNNTNRADELGISVRVLNGLIVVAKYNKSPCKNLRECDTRDYTVEITTLVVMVVIVILILRSFFDKHRVIKN